MPIYFALALPDGPVKIGRAKDVAVRVCQIQAMSPLPLKLLCVLKGGSRVEKSLHGRFKKSRLHGEWFTYSPEMLVGLKGHLPVPVVRVRDWAGRPSAPSAEWAIRKVTKYLDANSAQP